MESYSLIIKTVDTLQSISYKYANKQRQWVYLEHYISNNNYVQGFSAHCIIGGTSQRANTADSFDIHYSPAA